MPFPSRLLPVTLVCAVVAGCSTATRFEPDAVTLANAQIVPAHERQVAAVLTELFGEPDHPRVPALAAGLLDPELIEQAAGPVESHQVGVTHGLYRRHCARCHGVTGDGRGPTALYQQPYPRDFRRGVFKHKSTERGAPPTNADLHAVLVRGVPGTAMPSFRLLLPEEREALVQYVQYLSLRGQMESALVAYVAEELDFDPDTGEAASGSALSLGSTADRELVGEMLQDIITRWQAAPSRVVVAESETPSAEQLDDPEWIAAGRELFHDAKRANCATCHGRGGVGGVRLTDLDDWSKRASDFQRDTALLAASAATVRDRLASASGSERARRGDEYRRLASRIARRRAIEQQLLPPKPAETRRLAGGVTRGADEPLALFRSLHEGVAGSPMPGVGRALSDQEVWRLVAYVRSLLTNQPTTNRGAPLAAAWR